MTPVLALSDGNAFYCSCERVFEPRLEGRPVIVLSNNDGCAIARTTEAKRIGIKMGDPFFKIRDLCAREGVVVRSSNYALYGDMSRRVNAIYDLHAPAVEVYSIDESFLDLTGVPDPAEHVRAMRGQVLRWTGIPTCVGLGPTKVLAKVANALAKRHPELEGVCDLGHPDERAAWLARMPVADVWGVGAASTAKLASVDVHTAAELRDLDLPLARKLLTVVGERLVLELRGVSCMAMELGPPTRKGCAVTRQFGRGVTDQEELTQAVATYASRMGEKLRRHNVAAGHLSVFFHTNPHKPGPSRSVSTTVGLGVATADTFDLAAAARAGVRRIWREGFAYSKAGVICDDLVPAGAVQEGFWPVRDRERSTRLMATLDAVNARHGCNSLGVGAAGMVRGWKLRAEMKSPSYTTHPGELPIARA